MSVQARRQEGQRPPPGAYLLVLLAGAVLTLPVLQLFPDWMVGPVQGVALVALAYLIAAVVLWWREPAAGRPAGPLAWFIAGRPRGQWPTRGPGQRPSAPRGPDDDPDFLRNL